MDYNKAALELHGKFPGKIAVKSLVECRNTDALSTAYTPGVAEPCRKIKANPEDVYRYTCKGRMVAVVSNGTAVLGLGNIGPEAALPVMEGKCVLFKEFGGVDAFPICIDAKTKEEVIAAVKAIAPTFGGINLEDIRSPECFEIEETLERELDIPVFHDDQHGTAIIVLAGLLNALKVVGKRIEDIRIVQNGPGAAGTAIIKMLMTAGARHIIAVDENGILVPGRPAGLPGHKAHLAEITNPERMSRHAGRRHPRRRCLYRHLGGRRSDPGDGRHHGQGRHRLCHGQPHPRDHARPGQGRRRAGDRHRPQRFPQPGKQCSGLPRYLQGCAVCACPGHQSHHEDGRGPRHCRADPRRGTQRKQHPAKAFDPRIAGAVADAVAKAARESGAARV